jgi:hypothetical protein
MRARLVIAALLYCTFGFAQKSGPPAMTCIGQWYNADDHSKTVWLGFRICRVRPASTFTVDSSSGPKRQFKLPFTSKPNSGPFWQRMNKDKIGCDLVLLELPFKTGTASWSLSAADGSRLLHGSFKIGTKGHPFSMPPAPGTVVKHRAKARRGK